MAVPSQFTAISIATVLAVVFGRLPSLGSWWCLDDWGQLVRAAGGPALPAGFPARFFSQHVWWSAIWPLLGMNAVAHASVRILLHTAAALCVVKIARQVSIGPVGQLVAGLLFAATPIAFTPLFWASGVQELLGGLFALLAVERWLAGGHLGLVLSVIAAGISILSKESAIALPLFLGALTLASPSPFQKVNYFRMGAVLLLALLAVFESLLVFRHFATSSGASYETGGALVWLGNFGKFGWWLPTVGPVFTAQVTWLKAIVGICFWALWGVGGLWRWRSGQPIVFAAWVAAVLSVAPALPLVNQARPYMGYLAAASGAVAVASLVPKIWSLRGSVLVAAALVSIVWGQETMRGRIGQENADGFPADPIVRASASSRKAASQLLRAIPPPIQANDMPVAILQLNMSQSKGGLLASAGPGVVMSPTYEALAGSVGASLVLGKVGRTKWINTLIDLPGGVLVVVEKVGGFQAWGTTCVALLYVAELGILSEHFSLAVDCLARVRELEPRRVLAVPVADVLGVPRTVLKQAGRPFEEWLIRLAIQKQISGEEYLAYSEFLTNRE